jgi:diguanylate cyclase (GGDEF)-like protein
MTDAPSEEGTVLLASQPAGRGDRQFACAIIAVSTLVFLVLAPLAKVPLTPLPAFIPIYQSAQLINDLVTAVFLLGQRQYARSNVLVLLAGGYLFNALMSTVHTLTFPGLFSPAGLLGAGAQTTAWLYVFWHGGFPLFVIAYATCGWQEPSWRGASALLATAAVVLAAVCAFALLATLGQQFLPPIMQGNHYTPALIVVVSSVWIFNLIAVIALTRRKPYCVLDLWLIVVMCAWLFDIALSAGFNAGRYDLGFYAGRIYGFLAASLVLVVLLIENSELYLQLIRLRESDREKAAELQRLSTVDPLTGIANRRAFEEALGQEWRRMMRHKTALSLLMIDVDYFKRFNDSYGHVAGDHCLRTVAQILAGRARRAGEMAARYGGEEFAVLLPHIEIEEALRLADLICASVRDEKIPHLGSAVAPCVTISVGVASIADLPTSAAALCRDGPAAPFAATVLVEAADHALYRAKSAGRNRVAAAGADDFVSVAA